MAQTLIERLYLAAGTTAVTRAVPMGDNNTVKIEVAYVASSATTTDVTATAEGSYDLANWEEMTNYQETHQNVPSLEVVPASTPMAEIPFELVRVKFEQNSTYTVVVDAAIHPWNKAFA